MGAIFISYRRDDSGGYAGRIYDHLCEHFGQQTIFMDVDAIQPGDDFVEVINQKVGSCDALIAVIGRQWLTITGPNGRRLDDPNDFVRLEIAAALARKIRVIPVLVGGAHMPGASELPDNLKSLASRNAIELTDTAFQEMLPRLMQALEEAVGPVVKPAPVSVPKNQPVLLYGGIGVAVLAAAGFFFFRGNSPSKNMQQITLGKMPAKIAEGKDFTIHATASSGLPVTITARGNCRLAGEVVTASKPGNCLIDAAQPGNENFEPATSIERSVRVVKAAEAK